ncbi:ABC transporter [Hoeflea sp. IMCC20628]|uniref:ATP-binding cassette domain-containing protein n=1 Tax=Hoeflea sp. IMCC20628 TaxID=1620421 RepID=UPI00063AB475|nr:ATP-binding cassette domain-containing protein [Hoeflea sp. IMCC20628]AKH99245.1 ABC transporter [Hoeflea sp. IMCC20628]
MIKVEALSKSYGETVALRDVSIDFKPGTVHCVLGENGSGKSTLVKILSGIVTPDSGSIRLDGQPLPLGRLRDLLDLGFATVFQEVLIAPDRSVADNIILGLDGPFRHRASKAERTALIESVLDTLGARQLPLDLEAGKLPLAAQQIVVIARALARNPKILILDEATAALDHGDREAVFAVMERMAAEGKLVIFISHRMEEVMRLSDDVSILRSGMHAGSFSRGSFTAADLLAKMAPPARGLDEKAAAQ